MGEANDSMVCMWKPNRKKTKPKVDTAISERKLSTKSSENIGNSVFSVEPVILSTNGKSPENIGNPVFPVEHTIYQNGCDATLA